MNLQGMAFNMQTSGTFGGLSDTGAAPDQNI
jgi:hypothetical protein